MVVEATEPNSAVASHRRFEPLLLDAGYRCVLFDGLNRFYAREHDALARRLLAAPANPVDDYVRYDLVHQTEEACRLAGERAALEARCARLERRVASLERSLARERAERQRAVEAGDGAVEGAVEGDGASRGAGTVPGGAAEVEVAVPVAARPARRAPVARGGATNLGEPRVTTSSRGRAARGARS